MNKEDYYLENQDWLVKEFVKTYYEDSYIDYCDREGLNAEWSHFSFVWDNDLCDEFFRYTDEKFIKKE